MTETISKETTESFRILTECDIDSYYHVLHEGYQNNKDYPISFDAMDATKEETMKWLQSHPTYGLFLGNRLVSAISLRMPWGIKPGPKNVPHIGHFVTDPVFMHKGYARKLLHMLENYVLKTELKTPFVTLGTADSHPWLQTMYEGMGFVCFDTVQLKGKKHHTLFFEKKLV